MADVRTNNHLNLREEVTELQGSFLPAGAGAPTGVTGSGVVSVTRSSAGLYLVTIAHVWPELLGVDLTLQLNAATDLKLQLGVVNLAAKTVEIRCLAVATATDIAANANNKVFFTFKFKTRVGL